MGNWKKLMVAGAVVGSLVLGSGPALAGPTSPRLDRREYRQQSRIYPSPRLDRREYRQQSRIYRGIASGCLTPWEFRLLEREQARIHFTEARMKADGRFTRWERARLHHRLNVSSRHIYRATHNRWRR